MTQSSVDLAKTPLNAWHHGHGARMTAFAGWDMPIEYSGITEEHQAVRTRAGLFDVSHMGQIEVAGKDALAGIQHISSNDAGRLSIGQAQYSGLLTEAGAFVDDMLVYRLADSHYMLVVNAGNIAKDFVWISGQLKGKGDVVAVNTSARYALIAIQGPKALEILQPLTGVDLAGMKYYWFAHGEVAGVLTTISRTGYTGEDGFEIFTPPQQAVRVWEALLTAGRQEGAIPVGLGARDTLRLEAAMRLHGADIDEGTTALEAGLSWIVSWKKGDFLGRAALERQKSAGLSRTLVGFEVLDKGIARHGHEVYVSGQKIGVVTSGTQTPFLKKAIGMAYVPPAFSANGAALEIDVRGRKLRAQVTSLPFYKRARS